MASLRLGSSSRHVGRSAFLEDCCGESMRRCLFLRGSRMALDKWELSPESLLKGSLQVFGLSGLGHGSGLLVFDPLLCHLQPTSPASASFIQSDGEWLSWQLPSLLCRHRTPAATGTISLLTPCPPHRNHPLALHLRPSPQPAGVAEPRGMRRVPGRRDGMLSPEQHLLPLLPSLGFLSAVAERSLTPLSWPLCSLCRSLTHPGLHRVLLDTAMPSCPSQEDPGEPLWTWVSSVSLGVTPRLSPPVSICATCRHALYVGVLRRRLCPCTKRPSEHAPQFLTSGLSQRPDTSPCQWPFQSVLGVSSL